MADGFRSLLEGITLIDLVLALLAVGFLHSVSRRLTLRIACETTALLFTDSWIIYSILFTSTLVFSFHLLGYIALASGIAVIHSATFATVLAGLWAIDRMIFGASIEEAEFLSAHRILKRIREQWAHLHPMMLGSLMIGGAIYLLFLIEAATRPPEGWDGRVYHLPLAAKWFQQASLDFIWESWKFQMPSNGELVSLLAEYLGGERLVALAYMPFTLLAMLVVRNLSVRVSSSPDAGILAMLGFGTLPIVLYNTFSVEVDMFAASFCLASLYLLVLLFLETDHASESSRRLALVAGLAFGLGLGARYVYAPLALFMTGLCIIVLAVKHSPLRLLLNRRVIAGTLVFVAMTLIPSAFWYIRNVVVTGNAMHPLEFSIGPHGVTVSIRKLAERPLDLVPSVNRDTTCVTAGDRDMRDWLTAPWKDCWYAGGAHFSENWGLGPVFASFIPTGAFVGVVLGAMSFRQRAFHPVLLLSMVAVVLLLYWWFFLFTLARSIFPVMGILFVCASYVVGVCSAEVRRMMYGLFLCAIVFNGVLLGATPFHLLMSRIHHHVWTRSSYYGLPMAIEHLPVGSVILNASEEVNNYPLFGERWQNRVVTDRALLEPGITLNIDQDFVKKWNIDYIFYDSRQKWIVNPSIIREVVVHQDVGENEDRYEQWLYRVSGS